MRCLTNRISTEPRCVKLLDAQVDQLFSFIPDDAIVVLMGDHGEEFDHGVLRHARLYDEVVRVPLFTRNLSVSDSLPDKVRQMDIAPIILDRIGHQRPTEWNGSPPNEERDTMILNTSPHLSETYVAIRTPNRKLINVYKEESRDLIRTEYYDLSDDPREENDIYDSTGNDRVLDLESKVQNFITNEVIDTGIECDLSPPVGNAKATKAVDQRLEALGYR